jgi:hypothetical protein
MTKADVMELCASAGARHGIDPLLLCAICEQESSYASDAIRLENGFYRRYTRPMSYSPVVEILLAVSFGLMQTMGESLNEMKMLDSDDTADVVDAINAYITDPKAQVDAGAKWFARKLKGAGGDIQKALCNWNGDQTGKYASEVLARRDRLKTEAIK